MTITSSFPSLRLRRLRQHPQLRALIRETELNPRDFISPIFVKAGQGINNPISSMPGVRQLSVDNLREEIKQVESLGIPGVLVFGIPEKKDEFGSDSLHPDGVVQRAIQTIKDISPDLFVIADTCFCEYTTSGHCGALHADKQNIVIDNDKTLALLAEQAIVQAKAGADMVAPSGMIDGMVKAIRCGLDEEGFEHIPILSYSTKFYSSLYGPFREAAEGAPKFGNRSSYQMDCANGNEALRETALDVLEGADMLMVKPASYYLDIIHRVKTAYPEIPLGAYQVSGEYAMIKAAAEKGWLNEKAVALESLLAIKRAGADFIISYFAKAAAEWL